MQRSTLRPAGEPAVRAFAEPRLPGSGVAGGEMRKQQSTLRYAEKPACEAIT